jgi:phenylalanyl-tRNA synthetase beta chain
MRNRLGMVGFRAVNNIVDITNYVLMEYGQPLHAFDFGALRDNIIVVRTARAGEKIVTIDGKERILEGGMLVIADGERPIAIAGIMGGIESEVSEGTANVLLESAYFKPQSVKRTSGKLHLCSGSSYRFERGVDYAGIVRASDRAAYFMKLFAGGTVCRGVIDRTPGALKSGEVVLRMPRLNSVLHTRVSSPGAKRFLKSLNMEVRDKGKGKLEVKAPSYRVDIKREADLIEEVARLYGYDRIEEVAPRGIVALVDGNGRLRGREILRDVLCALGFSEAICLSFMGLSEMDSLMWGPRNRLRNAVVLRNPVSEEFSCLRTSMVPPLMRCLALNAQKGNHDVRLFEFGNVFIASDVGMPPKEEERLALVATGHVGNAGWHSSPIEPDFFYMKGVVQEILKGTGASLVFEKKLFDGFHPGRSAELLLNGERCGYIGQIHPRVASSYGVRSVVTFLELNPKPLFTLVTSPKRYERLPRFPAVKRDIAVVVEEGLAAQKIIDCVYTALEGIADSVVIFDLYKGEQIPEDKKGIALSVKMRSQKGTLKESDITEALKKVHDALRRLGCEIREY